MPAKRQTYQNKGMCRAWTFAWKTADETHLIGEYRFRAWQSVQPNRNVAASGHIGDTGGPDGDALPAQRALYGSEVSGDA
jgi:hypothetical protein